MKETKNTFAVTGFVGKMQKSAVLNQQASLAFHSQLTVRRNPAKRPHAHQPS